MIKRGQFSTLKTTLQITTALTNAGGKFAPAAAALNLRVWVLKACCKALNINRVLS